MTDLLTENARLRAALADIAKQKRTDELDTEYDVEVADFETGYDTCINVARAALATPAPDAVMEAARVLLDNPQAAAQFVVEYMERETGLPFGDMIGLAEMQRIRAIAGDRT